MKRYLSVWLPNWPLTRLTRAKRTNTADQPPNPDTPFALVETTAHGLRLVVVNAAAQAQGLAVGLRFTDARARLPGLAYAEIDRAADARALEALAGWMLRFSPLVALDGTDGLMLETTGCAHLFGGEQEMLSQISERLANHHIPAAPGIASTQGAAWALARHRPNTCLGHGQTRAGLSDLPVTGLRLSENALTLLRRFGLTQIGQLYGIDRKALARRFRSAEAADTVLLRLDQALGRRTEPLNPLRPLPARTARLHCPDPIASTEAIAHGLDRLAQMLCKELGKFGQGARGFTLHAFCVDGSASSVSVTTAQAVRTPAHIVRLLGERLDQIDPGFGIDLLLLEAQRSGAMDMSAAALSGDLAASATDTMAVSALVDRIRAKLGETRVHLPALRPSHLPERAEMHLRFETGSLADMPAPMPTGPRPIRLFDPPERIAVLASVPDGPPVRFVWRRLTRRIVRVDGPERIAPEWWRYQSPISTAPVPDQANAKWLTPKLDPRADAHLIARVRQDLHASRQFPKQTDTHRPGDMPRPVRSLPRARDYYRIEDEAGGRYWVYRDGLYDDDRGGAPDWYVQGQFS